MIRRFLNKLKLFFIIPNYEDVYEQYDGLNSISLSEQDKYIALCKRCNKLFTPRGLKQHRTKVHKKK